MPSFLLGTGKNKDKLGTDPAHSPVWEKLADFYQADEGKYNWSRRDNIFSGKEAWHGVLCFHPCECKTELGIIGSKLGR